MSRFISEEIEYPQGIKRNLEEFVQETWTFVKRRDTIAVKDRIIVIQNKANSDGDCELMAVAGDIMSAIECPLPYTPQIFFSKPSSAADSYNKPQLEESEKYQEYNRKRPPHKIRLNKQLKVKSMMTQFIQLTWKGNWYVTRDGGKPTISDVNHWYNLMLEENFDAESGNLSALYRGGNWEGLTVAIGNKLQSQQDLMSEIVSMAEKEHKFRNSKR